MIFTYHSEIRGRKSGWMDGAQDTGLVAVGGVLLSRLRAAGAFRFDFFLWHVLKK